MNKVLVLGLLLLLPSFVAAVEMPLGGHVFGFVTLDGEFVENQMVRVNCGGTVKYAMTDYHGFYHTFYFGGNCWHGEYVESCIDGWNCVDSQMEMMCLNQAAQRIDLVKIPVAVSARWVI